MSRHDAIQLTFYRRVLVAGAILAAVAFWLGWQVSIVEQLDVIAYKALERSSQAAESDFEPVTGKQSRVGMRKQIVFSDVNERRHLRLASERSDLIFTYAPSGTSLVEHLEEVTCDMQEKLYYQLPDGREAYAHPSGRLSLHSNELIDLDQSELRPMQRIRHVEADRAIYDYRKDIFAAEHVGLTRFFAPAHTLQDSWDGVTPTMAGKAETVQFSMVGHDPSFQAYHLTLTLFSKEGLR